MNEDIHTYKEQILSNNNLLTFVVVTPVGLVLGLLVVGLADVGEDVLGVVLGLAVVGLADVGYNVLGLEVVGPADVGEEEVGVVLGDELGFAVGDAVGLEVTGDVLGLDVTGDALGLALGDALGKFGMYEQSWNAFQLILALQHKTTVGNADSHESLLLLLHGCSPTQSATHLYLYLSKEKVDKWFSNAFHE